MDYRKQTINSRKSKSQRVKPKPTGDPIFGVIVVQIILCVIIIASLAVVKKLDKDTFDSTKQRITELAQLDIQTFAVTKTIDTIKYNYDYAGELFADFITSKSGKPRQKPSQEQTQEPNQEPSQEQNQGQNQKQTQEQNQEPSQEVSQEQTQETIQGQNQGQTQEPSQEQTQEPQDGKGGLNPVAIKGKFALGEQLKPPANASFAPIMTSARLLAPISGKITSGFGYRLHPTTGKMDFHTGIDVAAAMGTDILSALPGKVSEIGSSAIYGSYIVIEHGTGFKTAYSHCSEIIAKVGMQLKQGERIAKVGSTGISTGPHLHFEIKINDIFFDPSWVLS